MRTLEYKTIRFDGLSCSGCVRAVEQALADLPGVKYARELLEQRSIRVLYETQEYPTLRSLYEQLKDHGFSRLS